MVITCFHCGVTPPKINVEPENNGLEDDFCILRFHVNLPVSTCCLLFDLFDQYK